LFAASLVVFALTQLPPEASGPDTKSNTTH
jgi:hypothetical protein